MISFSPIKSTKKFIAIGVIAVVFSANFLFLAPPAHAQYWGATNIFADLMMNVVQNIQYQIQGALLGTLKMAAIQMLNSKVGQLVGGVAGSKPLFITDYNEYLFQTPKQRADLYMNDFFSITTRGTGSSANYISAGGNNGLSGNYASNLITSARNATSGGGMAVYNLNEYASSPDEMFARGDFRGLNAFFSNPANNTFGYTLEAQMFYQQQLDNEMKVAAMKAIAAGGYLPAEKGGVVTAPAATIEAAVNNVQDLGNKMIAAATNPGELLAGAVSAVANKLVSNMIQKGVGQVQSNITKAISNVDNKIYGKVLEVNKTVSPAVNYMGNVNQNLNVIMKPNTPPPPPAIPMDR